MSTDYQSLPEAEVKSIIESAYYAGDFKTILDSQFLKEQTIRIMGRVAFAEIVDAYVATESAKRLGKR